MFSRDELKKLSEEVGFTISGVSEYKVLDSETVRLSEWVSKGLHASMTYMENNIDKKRDVREILPGAKSIISLALNYYNHDSELENLKANHGIISRYARGTDYHFIMWDMCKELISRLEKANPGSNYFYNVDTGPVMDKVWAIKGGIGWQGKHSNIINRKFGSWFFLAAIITDLEFEDYSLEVADFCGNCTACIDSCPTNAITSEYIIDSNKCISFLTIENKGDIAKEFTDRFDNRIFGCDICQDVCPWNVRFSQDTEISELRPEGSSLVINLNTFDEMEPQQFNLRFKHSPMKRAKLKGMRRNANFLKGNED